MCIDVEYRPSPLIVKSEDAFVAVDRRRKNKKKREKKIEMKILNIETSILNILFCTQFVL